MSYQVTKNRVLQYIGIILIIGVFAGAYWYFKVYAGVKTNALSPTGSLTSGLVGYWPFDRVSVIGTTSLDRSTSKYNGSLSGGPTVTSGQIGQALNFDGSDDFMSLGSSDYLNVNATADMTISGWFFRDTFTTDDVIVAKIYGIGPGETGYGVYISSGDQLIFKIGDGVQTYTVTTSMTFTTSVWTHFSIVWDQDSAANTKIYINGQSVSTSTSGTISDIDDASYSHTFRVGALSAGGEPFDGKIDEVRVYNRTLTANEVLTLYSFTGIGSEVNSSASQPQGTGRLDSGLAGYWKLDEGSGTSAADSSTNANTGTLTNGPTWTTGQIGSAVDFDGTNDYITMGDQSIHEGMAMMALSGWIKMDALPASNYFVITKSSAIGQYRLAISSTGMPTFVVATTNNAWYSSGTTASGTTALTTSAWTHLLGTYDGQYVRLYVNGVLVGAGSQAISGNIVSSTSEFRLSYDSYGNYFNGQIDEVRLYSRALSADEVADLYRLTSPTGVDTSLKGYWSFNGQDISGTTAYDRSGAGNTGTLTNGPTVTPGKVGQALSFDGTNDYVSLGNYTVEQTLYSVAFWVFQNGSGSGTVFHRGDSGGCFYNPSIKITSSTVSVDESGCSSTGLIGSGALPLGWHQVVVTRSGSTVKLYIDGILSPTSGTPSTPLGTASGRFTQGATWHNSSGYLYYLNTSLDEVRLYNRALSAAEIQSLYKQGQSDEVNTGASQPQGTGRLDSGLAGYWKLDDGSGTSATDSSTNANTGTLTNGPTWTTGQIGGAVDFDGTNDYVTMPDNNAVDVADGQNFSISGWFNRDTFTSNHVILAKKNTVTVTGDTGYGVYIGGTTDKLTLSISDGTDTYLLESSSTFTATGWYHFTAVWDDASSSNTKMYIDGVAEAATATGTFGNINSFTNGATIKIGADSNGGVNFDGKLDEIRIYTRALSSDEVADLYRLTSPSGTETSLKGYWSFNGQDVSGTTAYDRSGAGNNGTLTSGPSITEGKMGQALSFDGVDDYVDMTNTTTAYQFPDATFTVAGWFKTTSSATSYIITQEVCSGGWGAYTASGRFSFRLSSSGSCGSSVASRSSNTATLNDGVWHHFVVIATTSTTVSASNDITIYIDGNLDQGTISRSGQVYNPFATNLKIGVSDGLAGYFSGSIDESRIYNRSLSATEIQSLYNQGR